MVVVLRRFTLIEVFGKLVAMISLLLGLGNIGKKYVGTRHNLGFELLDRMAAKFGVQNRERTDLFDFAETRSRLWGTDESGSGEKQRQLILGWPRTYVNCSGEAAVKLLDDNQVAPSDMLILVDDFNLPLGAIRFRTGGSDGGHNGLASLIETLGTEEFPRLRMGIGPVDKSIDIVDFVLSKFTAPERKSADTMLDRAVEAVLYAIDHRLEEAMSKYNYNPAPPESA